MRNFSFRAMGLCCLLFALAACKPEVDVMGTNDAIAQAAMAKAHSYAAAESGLKYSVIEYTLTKEGEGTRVERTFADGAAVADKKASFTYSLADYDYQNASRSVLLEFADGSSQTLVWQGGVLSDDNASYSGGKVADAFKTLYSDLPNTDWKYEEATYFIDTIPMDSLKYDSVFQKIKDPATGEVLKNHAGGDSIAKVLKVDTVRWNEFDTIAEATKLTIAMTLNRASNVNTGSYSYEYTAWTRDTAANTITVDSTYKSGLADFHWGFESVVSAKRGVVLGVNGTDSVRIAFSDFAKKDKALVIEGKKLKLQ